MSAINQVGVLEDEVGDRNETTKVEYVGKTQGKINLHFIFRWISTLDYQQSIQRPTTTDKSKLIIRDEDDSSTDVANGETSAAEINRNKRFYESVRSTTSTSSQQPLKLSGLSYAFSSSTLPNNTTTESTIGKGEGTPSPLPLIKFYRTFPEIFFLIESERPKWQILSFQNRG